jgi:hypothetical protein
MKFLKAGNNFVKKFSKGVESTKKFLKSDPRGKALADIANKYVAHGSNGLSTDDLINTASAVSNIPRSNFENANRLIKRGKNLLEKTSVQNQLKRVRY